MIPLEPLPMRLVPELDAHALLARLAVGPMLVSIEDLLPYRSTLHHLAIKAGGKMHARKMHLVNGAERVECFEVTVTFGE